MNTNYNFSPGDIISVNDCLYIVVKNYGQTGLVKEYRQDGTLINNFKWANKDIKKVENQRIKDSELKYILKEFESFF